MSLCDGCMRTSPPPPPEVSIPSAEEISQLGSLRAWGFLGLSFACEAKEILRIKSQVFLVIVS